MGWGNFNGSVGVHQTNNFSLKLSTRLKSQWKMAKNAVLGLDL